MAPPCPDSARRIPLSEPRSRRTHGRRGDSVRSPDSSSMGIQSHLLGARRPGNQPTVRARPAPSHGSGSDSSRHGNNLLSFIPWSSQYCTSGTSSARRVLRVHAVRDVRISDTGRCRQHPLQGDRPCDLDPVLLDLAPVRRPAPWGLFRLLLASSCPPFLEIHLLFPEPAYDHFGEHACSPPTGRVMAFKVGAGQRGDNSPRWSRPPGLAGGLPPPNPKELTLDLGGRDLAACAMLRPGKASQTESRRCPNGVGSCWE